MDGATKLQPIAEPTTTNRIIVEAIHDYLARCGYGEALKAFQTDLSVDRAGHPQAAGAGSVDESASAKLLQVEPATIV